MLDMSKGYDQQYWHSLRLIGFYSTMCVYHVVINKKTSCSGISSPDEFLVNFAGTAADVIILAMTVAGVIIM